METEESTKYCGNWLNNSRLCARECGKILMSRKVEKQLKILRSVEVAPRVSYTSGGRSFGSQLCNLSRQLVQDLWA